MIGSWKYRRVMVARLSSAHNCSRRKLDSGERPAGSPPPVTDPNATELRYRLAKAHQCVEPPGCSGEPDWLWSVRQTAFSTYGNPLALADFAMRALHNSVPFRPEVSAIQGRTRLLLEVGLTQFGRLSRQRTRPPRRAAGLVCTDALTMRVSDMKRSRQWTLRR
jgi:hypothetical protein